MHSFITFIFVKLISESSVRFGSLEFHQVDIWLLETEFDFRLGLLCNRTYLLHIINLELVFIYFHCSLFCFPWKYSNTKCSFLDYMLFDRSAHLGEELRQHLFKIQQQFPNYVKEVRGKGLFNAVEFDKTALPVSAYDICLKMKERGILAKPTHDTIVRLTPPLSIR